MLLVDLLTHRFYFSIFFTSSLLSFLVLFFLHFDHVNIYKDEEQGSITGSDKAAEEEGEDLEDEEEYDEEEDDDRPRKKPRHGGFILDEAGKNNS